jgi:SAM-dependent methyltransferase
MKGKPTMKLNPIPAAWLLLLLFVGGCRSTNAPMGSVLAPVYAPLADQIVSDFALANRDGLGLDIGGGPGTLVVELAKRSRLYWVDVDIDRKNLALLTHKAEAAGVADHVAFLGADVQALPFRDGVADVIVSRGSYHFWPDTKKGFAEIWRVLKPGGVAYIGRGFPRDLPLDVARSIRRQQGDRMRYNRSEQAALLRRIITELNIRDYRLHQPNAPGDSSVNYGIWVEFHKSQEN